MKTYSKFLKPPLISKIIEFLLLLIRKLAKHAPVSSQLDKVLNCFWEFFFIPAHYFPPFSSRKSPCFNIVFSLDFNRSAFVFPCSNFPSLARLAFGGRLWFRL